MMPTYRTKAIEVDAFRWTGGQDQTEDPKWIVEALKGVQASIGHSAKGVFMHLYSSAGAVIVWPGDWLIHFLDSGNIEKRTPEEFAAEFEPLVTDDRPVDRIPRMLDARLKSLMQDTKATVEIHIRSDGKWAVSALMRIGLTKILAHHCVHGDTADEALTKAEQMKGTQ